MSSIVKRSIDAKTAQAAIEGAVARARQMGLTMCIAVTYETGELKAFHRMDGAPKLSVQIAQDKAYTSAGYGFPTHGWYDFIKDDPPLLHGIVHTPRLVVFGGGYPIKEKGEMIAAIGVSGGHYTQDMECA